MDRNIGRLLKALRSNQLERNTLFIFINDNGGNHTPSAYPQDGAQRSGNYDNVVANMGRRRPDALHYRPEIQPAGEPECARWRESMTNQAQL